MGHAFSQCCPVPKSALQTQDLLSELAADPEEDFHLAEVSSNLDSSKPSGISSLQSHNSNHLNPRLIPQNPGSPSGMSNLDSTLLRQNRYVFTSQV
ncbi:hypothetical protein P9112_001968 [Eukaryota sp. TZLM1-RC]